MEAKQKHRSRYRLLNCDKCGPRLSKFFGRSSAQPSGKSTRCSACTMLHGKANQFGRPPQLDVSAIGKKYGRLTVINVERGDKGNIAVCECECGSTSKKYLFSLRGGHTLTCGHKCPFYRAHSKPGVPKPKTPKPIPAPVEIILAAHSTGCACRNCRIVAQIEKIATLKRQLRRIA